MCLGIQYKHVVELSCGVNSSNMKCVPILRRGGRWGATLNTVQPFLFSQWVSVELCVSVQSF